MASFDISWLSSAARDLKKIGKANRLALQQIYPEILALAEDPFPPQSKKIPRFNARVRRVGDYRIFYTVDPTVRIVTIEDVSRRPNAYRRH